MFSARKLTSLIRTPTTNYVRVLSTAQQNVPKMFCYQCEQTHQGTGCTTKGVCGKDAKTSNLQDLLIHTASGVGQLAAVCTKNRVSVPPTVNKFLLDSIFSTVTNVNFDSVRIQSYIKEAIELQGQLTKLLDNSGMHIYESNPRPVQFKYVDDLNALDVLGSFHGVKARKSLMKHDDLHGLQEIALYGIKGAVAYFSHAERIRSINASAYTQVESIAVYKSLYDLLDRFINPSHDLGDLVGLAMDVGKFNLEVMRLLDQAHSASFGFAIPREATSTPKPGKAILVSGHDMVDLLYVSINTDRFRYWFQCYNYTFLLFFRFLNKLKAQVLMCIPMEKCCQLMDIRSLQHILILQVRLPVTYLCSNIFLINIILFYQ